MEQLEDSPATLIAGAGVLNAPIDETALARFEHYVALLREWSTRINLLGPAALRELWLRHMLDALTLLPTLPTEALLPNATFSLIDVGSGGGIPGIPLAILFPQWEVTLLEATGKKARFLETVGRELELGGLRVVTGRAEDAAHDHEHREAYDACTARAVAHTAALVELTVPFTAVRGGVYLYKGLHGLSDEIAAAEPARVILGAGPPTILPVTSIPEAARCLVRYVKIAKTPTALPRRSGLPEQRPLTAADGARIRAARDVKRVRRR